MRQGLHAWPQKPPHQENGVSHHKMNSPAHSDTAPLRLCGKCCRALPISEFRRRSKASEIRSSDCRSCHAQYEHDRVQKQRNTTRRRIVRKAADEVARCRAVDQAASIIAMLPAAFGGVETLFRFWTNEVQRGDRPSELVRYCELWYRFELLQDAAHHQRQNRLGTPEYAAEMEKDLQELVRNNPEIVADAHQRISGTAAWSGAEPKTSDF
jgi:hypothetical protein